jgi:hypothetical protein
MLKLVTTEQEARAIMAAGLGKAELEFAASVTAPLYWVVREPDKPYRARNGSAFFLDAGNGQFGVTANHVIEGWRRDRADVKTATPLQLGHDLILDLDGKNSVIAAHSDLDIATFRITPSEIASINKTCLTGYQKTWPPSPPTQDRGIYYSGFPSVGNLWLSPNAISFAAAAGGGIASSVSETDVSTLIERQHLIDVLGLGFPPENFDFRGMSGGPMLTVVETTSIRSWALAGVIYQGPNPADDETEAVPGLEIIKARRAHFILPDGQLDLRRWHDIRSV